MPITENENREKASKAAKAKLADEILNALFSGYDFSTTVLWNASLYLTLIIANPLLAPVFLTFSILTAIFTATRAWISGKDSRPEVRAEKEKESKKNKLVSLIDALHLLKENIALDLDIPKHQKLARLAAIDALDQEAFNLLDKILDPSSPLNDTLKKTKNMVIVEDLTPIPVKEKNRYVRWAQNLFTLIVSYLLGFWFIFISATFFNVVVFTSAAAFLWPLIFVGITVIPLYFYQKNRAHLYEQLKDYESEKNRALIIDCAYEKLLLQKYALEKMETLSLSTVALSEIELPTDIVVEEKQAAKKIHFWPKLNMLLALISGIGIVSFGSWIVKELATLALGHAISTLGLMVIAGLTLGIGILLGASLAYLQFRELKREEAVIQEFKRINHVEDKLKTLDINQDKLNRLRTLILEHTREINEKIQRGNSQAPFESLTWVQNLSTLFNPTPDEYPNWTGTKKIFHRLYVAGAAFFSAAMTVRGMIGIYAAFTLISAGAAVVSLTGVAIAVTCGLILATVVSINTFHFSQEKGKTIEAVKTIDIQLQRQEGLIQILQQKEDNLRARKKELSAIERPSKKLFGKIFAHVPSSAHPEKMNPTPVAMLRPKKK